MWSEPEVPAEQERAGYPQMPTMMPKPPTRRLCTSRRHRLAAAKLIQPPQ